MDPFILLFFLALFLSAIWFGISGKLEKKYNFGALGFSVVWVAGLVLIWGLIGLLLP